MKNKHLKYIFLLHILLMFFSLSGVFSKMAANTQFLSKEFCLYYGIELCILAGYALAWQQIIKHLPLTAAFANKAVTIVWGIIWGALLFHETITVGKIIGAIIVIAGIVLYSLSERVEDE